jgi:MYXO-CTERM domain-containing protein
VTGGTVQIGDTVTVRFDVKVTASMGTLLNQGTLTAAGDAGAPQKQWLTDGDPATVGAQPTSVTVSECDSDTPCSGKKPHCDLTTHVCIGCTSDADCKDPANPACEPSGACGQCSGTNKTKCIGDTPACNESIGLCTLCTLGAQGDASKCKLDPKGPVCVAGASMTVHCGCLTDPDCGGPKSGKVCDAVPEICEDGCRGMGGNGCPDGMECTSKDTTIGKCVTVSGGSGGGGGSGGSGTKGSGGAPSGIPQDPGDTGGCGCRVPSEEGGDLGGVMAGAIGLLALASRRRRR